MKLMNHRVPLDFAKAHRSPINQNITATSEVRVRAVNKDTTIGIIVFGKAAKAKHTRPLEKATTEPIKKYKGACVITMKPHQGTCDRGDRNLLVPQ
jgi:hypothetical protein